MTKPIIILNDWIIKGSEIILIRYFSGKKNGWQDYGSELHFIPCTRPGHQACLDQYETDGNIQFH